MEDPRISRMYLARMKDWLHSIWRRNLMRSGWITVSLLACVLAGLTGGYIAHLRGNFHKLKAKMADVHPEVPVAEPGGQEPVTLMRTRLGDTTPEFLSVTLLPGRGMNALQISAYIPGKGEVNLLASPSVEDADKAMTGQGDDTNGQASLTMGSAFEAPWADRMWGTTTSSGHISTEWRGRTITLPSTATGETEAAARDGLLLAQPSDTVQTSALPDGGEAEAVFHAGDFGGRWPSKTDITVSVLLGSRSVDLTMTARDTGDEPEPVGLGWYPRFAILGSDRQQMRLRIPGDMRAELRGREKGVPTGKLLSVAGTPYDFTLHNGAVLGNLDLDDCFMGLHQDLLDSGPIAELSDPASNYALRLTALSPTIKAIRVVAPAKAGFISIAPQFNFPDPFGKEWRANTDTGMVVLQPGQSTEWKVRLELVSLESGRLSLLAK